MSDEIKQPMTAKMFMVFLMLAAVVVLLIVMFRVKLAEPEPEVVIPKTMEPVKAETYIVNETKLHVYSFVDSHGRNCTAVYAVNAALGGWGDCEYPPK
jgi:hypothetical protein